MQQQPKTNTAAQDATARAAQLTKEWTQNSERVAADQKRAAGEFAEAAKRMINPNTQHK